MSGEQAQDQFYAELFNEDALGVVIRAAIRIEAEINRYFDFKLAHPDALPKLEFKDRIALAQALGLAIEFSPGIRSLANLRNKFAHRIGTTLSSGDINNFYKALSPVQKSTYQSMVKDVAKAELRDDMNKLRLMLASVYLELRAWIDREIQVEELGRTIFDVDPDPT